MRSFITAVWMVVLMGDVEGRVLPAPTPVITPAPNVEWVEAVKRQGPDAVSLAQVLLTAIPQSLRQIAATNVGAVSSILWEEFLDDKKPKWFTDLPFDIQSYLIQQFGPATAIPILTESDSASQTEAVSSQPVETSQPSASDASSSATESTQTSEESQSPSTSLESSSVPTSTATISTDSTESPSSTESGASATDSAPPAPTADPNTSIGSGLTKRQKIGIGLGVTFGILGAAALFLGCCFLLRRRRRKSVNGSIPPSSPGFIPRFAFQEKSNDNLDQHHPLNRASSNSFQDLHNMNWEEEDFVDYSSSSGESVPTLHNPQPIMTPALYHTHSSNRARGKRTSYSSLHAVTEVTEPDESESPVLPRNSPPRVSPLRKSPSRHSPKRRSPSRSLIPPPVPAVSQIKRKPVPSSTTHHAAADLASQSLLRQTMPDHFSISTPSQFGNRTTVTSNTAPHVSPAEDNNPKNPFSNSYSYEEDYGPEYYNHSHSNSNDDYVQMENGLYGGHTNVSRYPARSPKSSKTEWPLRNFPSRGQNKSPMWDRVYEG